MNARRRGTGRGSVTAFDDDRADVVGSGSDQLVISGRDAAEKVARDLAVELSSPQLQVAYFAVHGSPAHALMKQADQYDARMIVVGNMRMRGLGRYLAALQTASPTTRPVTFT
ncbi:universal stress protein [Arthrobacter sp. NPDC056886]|uniref:universal stress protein n=1 Tax=Arthrobacter sp. NPDC056886 TaxID=3345960 RepID=UPI00366ECE80